MNVLVSVFNNLLTDQRIEKICNSLFQRGYHVQLIGCSWGGMPEMQRPYPFTRIELKSKTLKLAYAEFNLKLYSLLKEKANPNTILVANDLDTILPNFLVSQKMGIPLLYDSHEIFTEMPSVQGRWTQKIWQKIEAYAIPKIKYRMTANESYAQWYAQRYQIPLPIVVRNLPQKQDVNKWVSTSGSKKIILYQGAINPSRGLDKVIPAMKNIENAELWIAGNGPRREEYILLTNHLKLQDKVKFLGQLSPNDLREITVKADVGLSIEENNGLSYYYSLPNKISDYIQSGVPVVCSNFPEMIKVVKHFEVGEIIENHSEEELQKKIRTVLQNGKIHYAEKLKQAAEILCWENEENPLLGLYQQIVDENFKTQ
ncbi:MAG: glycosyltransferase [Bacteroidetes bacterium]|nr:glycosyltransferase [Bacteroidota bacterium]